MMINKQPQRRCAGCMKSYDKCRLLRIALNGGVPTPDPCARLFGRGVYVCKNRECLEKAIKKNAISRGLKAELSKKAAEGLLNYTDQLKENK